MIILVKIIRGTSNVNCEFYSREIRQAEQHDTAPLQFNARKNIGAPKLIEYTILLTLWSLGAIAVYQI